jgi:hypothetical protein
LTGVAVNVAPAPAQIVVLLVTMLTDGVTVGLTVIVILLEVTLAGEAHAASEIMVHDTTSLLASVVVV